MSELITQCQAASFVEDAADVLLAEVLSEASQRLPWVDCLSAAVHLRPGDSYTGLFARSPRGDALPNFQPSTTAWWGLQQGDQPLLLDVLRRRMWGIDGSDLGTRDLRQPEAFQSRAGLLERSTTHVIAVPLRFLRGALMGMVTLELSVQRGQRELDPWLSGVAGLQDCVDRAAPYLLSLPHRPAAQITDDPLLPVVVCNIVVDI